MTKIIIHGQKMQYHKKVAISVTLTSGTGGTATFTPETGTSYALSSLPIGSKIAKSSSLLYTITDSSGTTLGSISLSESSGYEISNCDIVRGGMHVAINNTTLEDGDIITAEFKANTIRIHLSGGSYGVFYNQDSKKISYIDIPKVDGIRFNPMQNNVDGYIEAYYNGQWIRFASYSYLAGNIAYFIALAGPYGQTEIDFEAGYGLYYTFPDKWGLPSGYQYLDNSSFTMGLKQSCEVTELQSMSIPSNEFTQTIESYVLNNYSFIKQIQQWRAPNNGHMIYTFYDSMFHMVCSAVVTYLDRNGQLSNTEIVTAFSTDRKGNAYCSIYDREGHLYDTYGVRERPSNLVYIPNIWADVYQSNTPRALDTWVSDWNCGDTCGLIQTIYNLATNK